jgi:hypothetical protein
MHTQACNLNEGDSAMGVEFTQSGNDIIIREDEDGEYEFWIEFDDEIVEDVPGFNYVSREDQDKFERLLTDPFGR